MRLLIVVQRYGQDVFGGAEQHARLVAERFRERGDDVEVLTSCAVSYVDWSNVYPPGDETAAGVVVHRLPVMRPRDPALFGPLSDRLARQGWRLAPAIEDEWMRLQGPELAGLQPWLRAHSSVFDIILFFTYLYYTTWAGMRASRAPTVLQPTAHDEPPARLTLFDDMFRLADGFAFGSYEEAAFVLRRFGARRPNRVVGIGFEPQLGQGARFRQRFHLVGDAPYLLCVGRTEPGKGSLQLFEFFREYKRRRPSELKLVFMGEEVFPIPRDPDVIMTGYVDDACRNDAFDGALALVQPSFFESFSMVLAEGWAAGLPALVQGRCAVLAGQAWRSDAALTYTTFGEFETAVQLLEENSRLRDVLGRRGRAYVETNYSWTAVLGHYDDLFYEMATRRTRPTSRLHVAAIDSA